MEDDKELFSDDIDNMVIDEYFYGCPSKEDYGMLFRHVMKKLNRLNQKIDLILKGAGD